MDRALWDRCRAHIRATEAADLGCDVADFDSHALTIVPRPEKVLYPEYAALITTFGTGTVISVDAAHIDWVRANPPAKHFHAFNADFLSALAAEVERSAGAKAIARSAALGFALADEPAVPAVPAGFSLEERDVDWMRPWRETREFHDALGEPDEDDWFDRLSRAFVLFDESGEAAAAAGVADDGNGSMEIGLDVRRPWWGRGLARVATLAAARSVLDEGKIPYYTCTASNVRSHLVAESSGFRPFWTVTGVARITEGVGSQE